MVLLCIVGIVHWSRGIRKCLEVSHFCLGLFCWFICVSARLLKEL